MYGKRQPVASGGLLSTPKATVSKETQDLLKVMMRESQLTNFQVRQLDQKMKCGESLPLYCSPTSSQPTTAAATQRKPITTRRTNQKRTSGGLRTHSTIIAQVEKDREIDQCPPLHVNRRYNSSTEKEKLQNLMAGIDKSSITESTHVEDSATKLSKQLEDQPRSYDEIVEEITERQQFLEEMESLGKGKEYRHKITSEISQRLRELEMLDKEI